MAGKAVVKKKSLVGWTYDDWKKYLKWDLSTNRQRGFGEFIVDLPQIFKKKNSIQNKSKKVRITIEELK